jgi:hypothetical protein
MSKQTTQVQAKHTTFPHEQRSTGRARSRSSLGFARLDRLAAMSSRTRRLFKRTTRTTNPLVAYMSEAGAEGFLSSVESSGAVRGLEGSVLWGG